jgi:hypothetical protein
VTDAADSKPSVETDVTIIREGLGRRAVRRIQTGGR